MVCLIFHEECISVLLRLVVVLLISEIFAVLEVHWICVCRRDNGFPVLFTA